MLEQVVASVLEDPQPLDLADPRREHDDRQRRVDVRAGARAVADAGDELEAVPVEHAEVAEIDEHEVDHRAAQQLPGGRQRRRAEDLMAVGAEVVGKEGPGRTVGTGDEDRGGLRVHGR